MPKPTRLDGFENLLSKFEDLKSDLLSEHRRQIADLEAELDFVKHGSDNRTNTVQPLSLFEPSPSVQKMCVPGLDLESVMEAIRPIRHTVSTNAPTAPETLTASSTPTTCDVDAGRTDSSSPIDCNAAQAAATTSISKSALLSRATDSKNTTTSIASTVINHAFCVRSAWQSMHQTLSVLTEKQKDKKVQEMEASIMKANSVQNKIRRSRTRIDFSQFLDTSNCMLKPQGLRKMAWDMMGVLSIVFHDILITPLEASGLVERPFCFELSLCVVIYWTLDIGINFMTGVYIEGNLVMKYKKAAHRYVLTWFVPDVFMVMVEWISIMTSSTALSSIRALRSLRILRAVRLLRLMRLHHVIKTFMDRINSTYLVLCLKMLQMTFILLGCTHVVACLWYTIGRSNAGGWANKIDIADAGAAYLYFTSLHWALSQLHASMEIHPRTLNERLFATLIVVFALFLFSSFLSSITSTVMQLGELRKDKDMHQKILREYLRDHNISAELSVRVKMYLKRLHDQVLVQSKHERQTKVLDRLPSNIMADLYHEAWSPILAMHRFFAELSKDYPRLLRTMCHQVVQSSVEARETVFSPGDACVRCLFIERGKLVYACSQASSFTFDGHQQNSRVQRGNWLSEAALWTVWQNTGELKSLSYSVVLALDESRFSDAVKLFPKAHIKAAIYAERFVQTMNDAGCTDLGLKGCRPIGLRRIQRLDAMSLSCESWTRMEDLI